jgi:hypothetical protein
MAQITILILLIVLAFFLVRGFAWADPHGSYRPANPSGETMVPGSSGLAGLSGRIEVSKIKQ